MRLQLLLAFLAFSLTTQSFAAAPPTFRRDRDGEPLPQGAVARLGSARLRHVGGYEVALSGDGAKVITAGDGMRVWDCSTGKLLASLEPDEDRSGPVAFAPDGKSVLYVHRRRFYHHDVWTWDLATGKRRALWRNDNDRDQARSLLVSPDGKTLAVCCDVSAGAHRGHYRRIQLCDYPSGKYRGEIFFREERYHFAEEMGFDRRGRLVLATTSVLICDVGRMREIGRLGGRATISSFALSPQDEVAAIQSDPSVKLVRLDTGRVISTGVKAGRSCMGFSSDGKELFVKTSDGDVVAIDPKTGEKTRTVVPSDGGFGPVREAFSADGRWLARSDGQSVRVHDLRTGKQSVTFDDHRDGRAVEAVPSPDGRLVATRSKVELRIWDRKSGKMLRRIAGAGFVPGLSWTPDGKQVAAGVSRKFCWFDIRTGKLVREVPLPRRQDLRQASLSPDGKRVILDDVDWDRRDHSRWVLRADDGKEVARYKGWWDDREPEAIADGGRRAAFSQSDGERFTLQVKTVPGGKVIWERSFAAPPDRRDRDLEVLREPDRSRIDAHFLAAGRLLVLKSAEGTETWDVDRGRRCGPPLPWNGADLLATRDVLAVSSDGRTLALGMPRVDPGRRSSTKKDCLLVEVASGHVRTRLPNLASAAFTGDGGGLITSSYDGAPLVWAVDELAARSLTGREWADLAGDGRAAFVAVSSLVVYPVKAVELLTKELAPSRLDAKRVRKLLDDLDDESFDVRQAAEKALAALGDHVEEDLRRELASGPSQERRLRLARLLRRSEASPDRLRRIRAVEVLERIGSPEATGLLKRLAAGHPGASQTREASEALARLNARK